MQTTGYFFVSMLYYVVVVLAALPIIIILAKGLFKKELFTWLLLICLTETLTSICLFFSPSLQPFQVAVFNISQLILFACFTLMVRSTSQRSMIRNVAGVLLVAVLSILSTYFVLGNLNTANGFITVSIQLSIFLLMIWLFNIALVRHPITVFSSGAFWIAAGTFFYYTIRILFSVFENYFQSMPSTFG